MEEFDNSSSVKGWKFPPAFNVYSKTVDTVNGDQSIKESLQVLLTTIPGERLMELDYGCDLSVLAFKTLDTHLVTFMTNNIRQAIERWEKRINVQEILIDQVNDIDGVVKITIQYVVLKTTQSESFVLNYSFS